MLAFQNFFGVCLTLPSISMSPRLLYDGAKADYICSFLLSFSFISHWQPNAKSQLFPGLDMALCIGVSFLSWVMTFRQTLSWYIVALRESLIGRSTLGRPSANPMWQTTIPWLLQVTGWIPTKFWVVYQGWIACWVMLCRPSILTTLCTRALFLLAFLGGTLLGSVLCARSLWLVVVAGQGSLYTFWVKKQGCIARQSFQCRPSVFATQHMENLWLFAVTAWGPSRTQATFPSSLVLEGHWAWPYQVQSDLLRLHSLVDYAV